MLIFLPRWVYFTRSIGESLYRIMKKPVNIWVYMDIFQHLVWYACAVSILTVSLGYSIIIFMRINYCNSSEDSEKFNFFNVAALTALFPLHLMLGPDVDTKTVSAKIICLSIGLMSGFIWSHYSSDLMARMTFAPEIEAGIESFQDAIDGNFRVVVFKSSAQHEFLKNADPTSAKFKYYYDNMDGNSDAFVDSTELEQAKTILLESENTLIYTSGLALSDDDRFIALKMTDSIYITVGWAFQKRSEFTEFFNHHLNQMKATGVMNKLSKQWKNKVCSSPFALVCKI
jgi:hypothetical protein